MSRSQKELEELYQKVTARARTDKAFLGEMKRDLKGTMEKVAGHPLPGDLRLSYIEKDSGFGALYSVPDFTQGELDMSILNNGREA